MRAYLVRHGDAKGQDVDPQGHLTDRGAQDVRRVATEAVADLDVRPVSIFHSGKARSRQTAEIWGGLVGVEAKESDGLAPNDDPSAWAQRLVGEGDDVMIVGHLPHLERLVGLLVTGDADRPVVGFPAGGLVVVDRGDDGWLVAVTRA